MTNNTSPYLGLVKKTNPASLYIDLVKKCLSGQILDPRRAAPIISVEQCQAQLREANAIFHSCLAPAGHTVENFIAASTGLENFTPELLQFQLNIMHRDLTPDTMSDASAINNLHDCVTRALATGVPGDFIETGVWKGGLPLLMRAILKAYGVTDRVVWAADSFEGLPKPDPEKNLKDAIWFHLFAPIDHLGIPLDYVEGVFRKYDLLDGQVKFLKGWFSDTLPQAPIERLAVMRLDGDWYESTAIALDVLYPKLSRGGFIIIDDYGLPFDCRKAVDEYRAAHGIHDPIQPINHQAVFWEKSGPDPKQG